MANKRAGLISTILRPAFYRMDRTREFHAGAMSYAFHPTRLNPVVNFYGTGILARTGPPVLQPRPLVAQSAWTTSGLGGLVQGQLVLQGLVNPNGGK